MPLRKRIVSLNCLKKLSPRSPSTPLSGGKSWHKTSRLVTFWPMAVTERTVVRGAYSMPLPVTMRCRSRSGPAGSYPSRAITSVAKIVKLAPVSSTTGITRDERPSTASSSRSTTMDVIAGSNTTRGIRRNCAGEMNAEVSSVLCQSAMNFVTILAMGNHAPPAKRCRCIQLEIF